MIYIGEMQPNRDKQRLKNILFENFYITHQYFAYIYQHINLFYFDMLTIQRISLVSSETPCSMNITIAATW